MPRETLGRARTNSFFLLVLLPLMLLFSCSTIPCIVWAPAGRLDGGVSVTKVYSARFHRCGAVVVGTFESLLLLAVARMLVLPFIPFKFSVKTESAVPGRVDATHRVFRGREDLPRLGDGTRPWASPSMSAVNRRISSQRSYSRHDYHRRQLRQDRLDRE
jgi:hypothetical protein